MKVGDGCLDFSDAGAGNAERPLFAERLGILWEVCAVDSSRVLYSLLLTPCFLLLIAEG